MWGTPSLPYHPPHPPPPARQPARPPALLPPLPPSRPLSLSLLPHLLSRTPTAHDSSPTPRPPADDTVDPLAISQFRSLRSSISPPCATALAFHHIPMAEMAGVPPSRGHAGVFDAAVRAGMTPWWASLLSPVIRLLPQSLVVGSSKRPCGLFDALKEARIPAAFCGHDHYNDYVAARDGVYMCYGRVTNNCPPQKIHKHRTVA